MSDMSATTENLERELLAEKEKTSQAELQAIQLQCIIDAKDRELAIVREHVGSEVSCACPVKT